MIISVDKIANEFKALYGVECKVTYDPNNQDNLQKIEVVPYENFEEAINNASFWRQIINRFEETKSNSDWSKISFIHEPVVDNLSLSDRIRKLVGSYEIEAKKEEVNNPKITNVIGEYDHIAQVILEDQNEWERLNEISHKSNSFGAPFVYSFNGHRALIPLNDIYEIEF